MLDVRDLILQFDVLNLLLTQVALQVIFNSARLKLQVLAHLSRFLGKCLLDLLLLDTKRLDHLLVLSDVVLYIPNHILSRG